MTDFIPSLKLLSKLNDFNKTINVLSRYELFEESKKYVDEESISYLVEFEKSKDFKILDSKGKIDKKNLKELSNYLDSIKVVTFRVARFPSLHFINKVYMSLQGSIKNKFVLNFIEAPEILGGAVIEFSGKNYDNSLLQNVQKFL